MNNYQTILEKLNEFIRKYYANQLIRGLILFLSLGIFLFLFVVLAEYFGQFNSTGRTALFFGFTASLFAVFVFWVVIPLLKFLSLGKRISHEYASQIIGKHFHEIDDKLSNILQLHALKDNYTSDLVIASINQKISELKPIPFGLAINFKNNTKYLKYLVVPMIIVLVLAAFEPKIIADGTNRLVAYQADFIPQAPYEISINNGSLEAYKNQDFTLAVELKGDEIPSKLNIIFSNQRFLMKKQNINNFQHAFKNMQRDIEFALFDGEFMSKTYKIKVLPRPLLLNFSVDLTYPPYLNKKSAKLENSGDLSIPEGTHVKWTFHTENTDQFLFINSDSATNLLQSGEEEFLFSNRYYQSDVYGLSTSNQYLQNEDTIFYKIVVIPDVHPSIEVDSKDDSLNPSMRYFRGVVKDDYGFSRLLFHYQFVGEDSIGLPLSENIPINRSIPQTDFYHLINTDRFQLKAGEKVEYYFEIWDNDGVNGSKSAKTQKLTFKAPTKEELSKKNRENEEQVKKELEESIQLTHEIRKDLEELNEKLLNKKELGFQEKKKLESLLEKQKKVQQSVNKLKEKNRQNNLLQEQYSPQEEALLEKQKQLQEMFEKLMSEEMKEMMKEIERLMEKLQKDQLQQALEKIELSNEELEKELDRNLELFKQLELEKELAEAQEKLKEVQEKQEELQDKTEDKKSDAEELKKEQDELKKEFEKVSEKLDEVEKKNQELEEPNPFEKTDEQEKNIDKEMQKSSEELSENKKKKASESQENSQKEMDELSQKLQSMQTQLQSQANMENLEDLRALLENLIQLSFDQEDVMQQLKKTDRNDPKYVGLAQLQKKIKDDSKIVEDSLFALSKRVPQLSSDINREMAAVNFNMKKAIEELGERRTPNANSRQQFAMTSLNNLALLLDAAVQSMQMQMQQQSGKQCSKPGSGKPSAGSMKKLQEQLNKQMEGLKKAMENGKKSGGKQGKKPGKSGMGGMSKELAQMAAKQAAIRKSLESMQQQLGEGEKDGGNLKKIGDLMEQTETDLVNKQISHQTLLRQQEILTRLLQSEKAERERENDEKRESTEFTDEISRNPNTFFEYNRLKEQEIELLKTLPPAFNHYYKTKVSEYFKEMQK